MSQTASIVTKKLQAILTSPEGMAAAVSVIADLNGITLPVFSAHQVIAQNVAPELIEKSKATHYPAVNLYCSKIVNQQREKFRTFSGEAQMSMELRLSQDRLEGLETMLQLYADAVTRVLDQHRGNWGDGVFYGGGYEIAYGPVKHGGRNFLQIAKLTFATEISTN